MLLSSRRILFALGATLASTIAACSVGSDSSQAPLPPEGPPSGAASEPGETLQQRRHAIDAALGELAKEQSLVHADARHTLIPGDVMIDRVGREHVRFTRTYLGLTVLGGDFVAHVVEGKVSSVSQELTKDIDLDIGSAKLDAKAAEAAALQTLTGVLEPSVLKSSLLVHARGATPALAYEVVIAGVRDEQAPAEMHVVVDAMSGATLESWDGIETAASAGTGNGFFVGPVALTTDSVTGGFELKDPSRGNMFTINMNNKHAGNALRFIDADNAWGNGLLTDPASVGVDAQYGTVTTWDYYLNVHGRNGIANDGKGAINRVHYGRNYSNAFWSDSCFCMTYGDGDGRSFNPFASLDVAGHEMTHGVTSRTAGLVYNGESGGLNEATSDIFGTAVEFYASNALDTPDYDIGEKLYKVAGKALRYMSQPSKDGASADCWYSNVGKLDVHYSSGVANHFFYLLAEGSSASVTCRGTDTNKATGGEAVTGIGRSAAERIWYRALTTYMTSSTKYAGARTATLSAATDLFGDGSPEVAAVAAAWAAVQVK